MVVDNVDDHRNPAAVGFVHEIPESVRPAVLVFHGKDVRRVVSAGNVASELSQRHEFDGVDAEIAQVVKLGNCGGE